VEQTDTVTAPGSLADTGAHRLPPLSGDTEVRVDVPSTAVGEMTPGAAVRVTLPAAPVLVAPRP